MRYGGLKTKEKERTTEALDEMAAWQFRESNSLCVLTKRKLNRNAQLEAIERSLMTWGSLHRLAHILEQHRLKFIR